MANITLIDFLLAFCGGILPAIIWLWFWLKEDKIKPEPKKIIIFTFITGMLMVFFAFLIEQLFLSAIKMTGMEKTIFGTIILLLTWAFIEEFLKYFTAKKIALDKISYDEPVDALIYLITAALGFAACENMFFLIKTINAEGLLIGFVTGNLRFIGATLLHTATSGMLGACIAFSFFHKENKRRNVIGGLFVATILHFIFNYFIIKSTGIDIFKIFIPLWIIIIFIIFIFEKVKKLKLTK